MSVPLHAFHEGYIGYEMFRLIVTIGFTGFVLCTVVPMVGRIK